MIDGQWTTCGGSTGSRARSLYTVFSLNIESLSVGGVELAALSQYLRSSVARNLVNGCLSEAGIWWGEQWLGAEYRSIR
jgi:hypothetical protein